MIKKTTFGPMLLAIVLAIFGSCKNDEPKLVCTAGSVTLFDKAFTRFTLSLNSVTGFTQLDLVKVYDGTDSSHAYNYTYTQNALSNIARTEDGVRIDYAVTLTGTKVSKFTSKTSGGKNKEEIRWIYSNDQATQTQVWYANEAGTLFQVGHNAYSYDAKGNLTKSDSYLDIAAYFTLAFGGDPTGYAPILFNSITYEPSDAFNPLKGQYFIDNLDMAIMINLPQKITYTGKSESYVIQKDGNGLPTKATSGAKYMEVTYLCK